MRKVNQLTMREKILARATRDRWSTTFGLGKGWWKTVHSLGRQGLLSVRERKLRDDRGRMYAVTEFRLPENDDADTK